MKVGNLVRFLAGASLSVLASINVNISKEIKSVCQRVIEKFAYRQIYTLDLENACLHTCNLHRNTSFRGSSICIHAHKTSSFSSTAKNQSWSKLV